MTAFVDHNDYIAAAAAPLQPLLIEVRGWLAEALPEAAEIISYNMPGFAIGDSAVAGYAAFSKQCGIYVSGETINACADAITAAGLEATKNGVKFSPKKPIPRHLVEAMAAAELAGAA